MVIDPTSNIGKLRLRTGDYGDVPWLPDNVYEVVLADNAGNLNKAASILAQYILAGLTRSTRSQLAQIASWDDQQFQQYKEFLLLTVTNPAFMSFSPIPSGGGIDEINPLIQFAKSWNAGYIQGTSEKEMNDFFGLTDVPSWEG